MRGRPRGVTRCLPLSKCGPRRVEVQVTYLGPHGYGMYVPQTLSSPVLKGHLMYSWTCYH